MGITWSFRLLVAGTIGVGLALGSCALAAEEETSKATAAGSAVGATNPTNDTVADEPAVATAVPGAVPPPATSSSARIPKSLVLPPLEPLPPPPCPGCPPPPIDVGTPISQSN
jgi:hypothetical protein